MAGPLNAKVILARCSKTRKTFGIRTEQRERDWVRTWAFPVDERKAQHEGFDAETVTGSLEAVDGYPGCPHCGAEGFMQHTGACGKASCNGGIGGKFPGEATMTCPWCGETCAVSAASSFNVSGGGY